MQENIWLASSERVLTSSRMWAWWLTHVHGYQVVTQKLAPKVTFYGGLEMAPYWILSAPATGHERN